MSQLLWMMAFSGKPTLSMSWGDLSAASPGAVSVGFLRDGDMSMAGGTPGTDDWIILRHATVGDDYDVRLTVNSGASNNLGPADGVWHNINTDRVFTLSGGVNSGNWTTEIRPAGGGAVLVSRTFNVTLT